eukprot:8021-Heterococcus_DN1.PRE.1
MTVEMVLLPALNNALLRDISKCYACYLAAVQQTSSAARQLPSAEALKINKLQHANFHSALFRTHIYMNYFQLSVVLVCTDLMLQLRHNQTRSPA